MREWVRQLPEDRMSKKAFDSLLEYSGSVPTGLTIGKVWKRNLNFGRAQGTTPDWVVCEYVADGPDQAKIVYRRPIII